MRISYWSSDVCSSDLLDEGGMTKGVKAEPARAEGELGLALQPRRIDIGEDEAAGNRPFAGRAGMLEDVKVGLGEAKGAWQPHGSRSYTKRRLRDRKSTRLNSSH